METKITQQELAAMLALSTGKQKETCDKFLKSLVRILETELEKGESIRIKGFGTFKVMEVEARKSVNVATGDEYEIPAHRRIIFVAGKDLSSRVNLPFEAFEAMEIPDDIPISMLNEDEQLDKQLEEDVEEQDSDSEPVEDVEVEIERAVSEAENPAEEVGEYIENTVEVGVPAEVSRFRFAKGFLAGFLVALGVVSCLGVGAYYMGFFKPQVEEASATTPLATAEPILAEKPNPVDSGIENKVGENVAEGEEAVPTSPSDIKTEGKKESVASPVYDTVTTTRYLTTIAKEHYGNFNLWPIIYEENQAILGHPDRIKPGTRVVVPPLSKYQIDPNNEAQVKEIKRKGVAIYEKFRK